MELGFLILWLINNYWELFTAWCYVTFSVHSIGSWYIHVGKLQMSGDTNLCSQLSPLKHLLCYLLSQTRLPSFPASASFKSYARKHSNLPKENPCAEEQGEERHVRCHVAHATCSKLTASHRTVPATSDGPETTKRYITGRGRIVPEISFPVLVRSRRGSCQPSATLQVNRIQRRRGRGADPFEHATSQPLQCLMNNCWDSDVILKCSYQLY